MTYPPPPPPRSGPNVLLLVLIGVGLLILVGGGVWLLRGRGGEGGQVAGLPTALTPRSMISAEQVTRELERDPMSRDVVVAFRETFPAEWNTVTQELAAQVRAGRSAAEIQQYGFERMRSFATSRAGSLASAPEPQLREVIETQLALARSIQPVNPGMCARFTFSGLSPADTAAFPPDSRDEMGRAVRAQLVATRAGTDNPVTREEPSQADLQAFAQAYERAGGDPAMLASGGAVPPGQEVQACQSGVAVYQGMAALPGEQGGRVMSFVIRQAAAAQGGSTAAAGPAPAGKP